MEENTYIRPVTVQLPGSIAKGGVALSESSIDTTIVMTLLAAMLLSALIPIYTFFARR